MSCCHTKALYGCESGHIDEQMLRKYTSQMLDLAGTSYHMHARSIVFSLSGASHDVDPYIAIFHRRISMFRRMLNKSAYIKNIVAELYDLYLHMGYPGVHGPHIDLSTLIPAPLPGTGGRQPWKATIPPQGPVGLLLQNSHYLASTVDLRTYTLRKSNHFDIHFCTIPFQLFKSTVLHFAFSSVHAAYSQTRTILEGLTTLDVDVFLKALPTDNAHHVNIVKSVASLGIVDQAALHRFCDDNSDVCIFCQQATSSVHHIIWHCPHPKLVEARSRHTHCDQKTILEFLDYLPLHILYGLPPRLTLMPHTPWWTDTHLPDLGKNLNYAAKKLFGIDTTFSSEDQFCIWLREFSHFDAYIAFQVINGINQPPAKPDLPRPVFGSPPLEPNVYSDGSLTHATRPTFGLATAAVWWPGRIDHPISDQEAALSSHQQTNDGLELS
eukprot:12407466-Karenia_brevis.AAC.1